MTTYVGSVTALVAGRWFEAGETWESGHAVVVTGAFAKRYWQEEEAIGRWVEWASCTPVFAVPSGEELLAGSYADRTFAARMLSFFAALALGLGLAGLYGVVAHSRANSTPSRPATPPPSPPASA